ncbi:hypothetical protein [Novosphingobium endophyticum]|uniref:hypothetical protein n=1 Tax=Novosphingobium endophyticum TaxID=1955250 RepID=UPI00166E7EFD|nr:hypothetical protein [Novosphingobium endophyticum]
MLDIDCEALLKRRDGRGPSTDPAIHDQDARTIRLLFVIHPKLQNPASRFFSTRLSPASSDACGRAARNSPLAAGRPRGM